MATKGGFFQGQERAALVIVSSVKKTTRYEEWNADAADSTIYLMHGSTDITPLRSHYQNENYKNYHQNENFKNDKENVSKYEQSRQHLNKFLYTEQQNNLLRTKSLERDKYLYEHNYEDEWNPSYKSDFNLRQPRNNDDFDENDRYRNNERYHKPEAERRNVEHRSRHNYITHFIPDEPVPKVRQSNDVDEQRYHPNNNRNKQTNQYYKEVKSMERPKQRMTSEDTRFYSNDKKAARSESGLERYSMQGSDKDSSKSKFSQDDYLIESDRRRPELRQRSPSPDNVSPRDRFKDAKEKFLLLERERLEEEERLKKEVPISPTRNERHFIKRHENVAYPNTRERLERHNSYESNESKERFFDEDERIRPTIHENVRYRNEEYRNSEKHESKRRSTFNIIEERHRQNSNEIAKELKRRTYMEGNTYPENLYRDRQFAELPESDRYTAMEGQAYNYSKSAAELEKVADVKYDPKFLKNQKAKTTAGYRHSYAEPKIKLEKIGKRHNPEMIHRTNSSVSNTGRVGIASIHPY